jgi:hypothetical protein
MLRSLILMEVETWTVFLPEKDLSSRIARMSGLGEPERLNQGVVRDPKAPETTSSFLNGKVWQSKTDDGTERCSVLCIYMIYIYDVYIYIYGIYDIYIYEQISYMGLLQKFLCIVVKCSFFCGYNSHKMLLLWCKT